MKADRIASAGQANRKVGYRKRRDGKEIGWGKLAKEIARGSLHFWEKRGGEKSNDWHGAKFDY